MRDQRFMAKNQKGKWKTNWQTHNKKRLFGEFNYIGPSFKKVNKLILGMALAMLAGGFLDLLTPYYSKLIFDEGIMVGNISQIVHYGLLILLFYLGSSLLQFVSQSFYAIASNRFSSNLKGQTLQRLLNMPFEFFDMKQTGYLVGRVSEADTMSGLFSPSIFQFLSSLVVAVGSLVIILKLNAMIALVLLPFLLLFFLISRWMGRNLRKSSNILAESYATSMGKIQEAVLAVAEIKQFTAEERKAKEIIEQFMIVASNKIKQTIFMAIGTNAIGLLFSCTSVTVIIVAGISIAGGFLSIGDYVALAAYTTRIIIPVQLFGNISITIQPILVSLRRLNMIFGSKTEQEIWGNKRKNRLRGDIKFNNVSFIYDMKKTIVLRDCSFSVTSGECVVVYGRNGVGKTTLLKLILGLYPNYSGQIYIDDTELHQYDLSSLRKRIGIVSQNLFLFTGSLKDNIKMADPEASDEAVRRVLELSGCRNMFDVDSDNVQIFELGRNLSGGQKQAAAISRCMLKDPDILLFDEATAHLDTNTRQIVMNALKGVFLNKTRILITQDRDLANIADRILFMEEGKVREIELSKVP